MQGRCVREIENGHRRKIGVLGESFSYKNDFGHRWEAGVFEKWETVIDGRAVFWEKVFLDKIVLTADGRLVNSRNGKWPPTEKRCVQKRENGHRRKSGVMGKSFYV